MQSPRKPIRIIIVDDQAASRNRLMRMLEQTTDFLVIGCADNELEGFRLSKIDEPDVIILHVHQPSMGAIGAVRMLKRPNGHAKVLLLCPTDDQAYVAQTIGVGIDGYLSKADEDKRLWEILRVVASGMKVFDASAVEFMVRDDAQTRNDMAASVDLNERDIQIIHMIMEGRSNREIAELLRLREGTTKNLVSLILSKTGTASRTQLVKFALDSGLIQI